MKHFTSLTFLLAAFGGCATDPEDARARVAVPTDDDAVDRPLADIVVPNPDGTAPYRFRFFADDDGKIATVVEIPFGAARPVLEDECALDTYLRVARVGDPIPAALLAACPRTHADAAVARRVAPSEASPLSFTAAVSAAALCTHSSFDSRVAELTTLAKYQPIIHPSHFECDDWVGWDEGGCLHHDSGGNDECDAAYYQSLLSTYGPSGYLCFHYAQVADPPYPNPACAHPAWTFGDYVNAPWQRFSVAANISKVRAELSVCGNDTVPGSWQSRETTSVAWSATHALGFPPHATSIVTLQAGWAGDFYNKWDFKITANGPVNVASSWVDMSATKHAICPIKI